MASNRPAARMAGIASRMRESIWLAGCVTASSSRALRAAMSTGRRASAATNTPTPPHQLRGPQRVREPRPFAEGVELGRSEQARHDALEDPCHEPAHASDDQSREHIGQEGEDACEEALHRGQQTLEGERLEDRRQEEQEDEA